MAMTGLPLGLIVVVFLKLSRGSDPWWEGGEMIHRLKYAKRNGGICTISTLFVDRVS